MNRAPARPRRTLVATLLAILCLILSPAVASPQGARHGGAVSGGPLTSSVQGEGIVLTRPIPGPVVPPPYFREALEAGTRSADGSPGPSYWQPWTEYAIDAKLDPRTGRLSARGEMRFHNGSTDEIPALRIQLHQNLHSEGAVRNGPAEVTGGVTLERVTLDGSELFQVGSDEETGYRPRGGTMIIQPPAPIPTDGEAMVAIDWSFTVPRSSSGRMGHSDREMYYIAYWFPKVGVYDDLNGWDVEPYRGGAEFYDSFGDYDVSLTVPATWTVMATGELVNPEEVLSAQTIDRLAQAAVSDAMVVVADVEDREENRVTVEAPLGTLTYRFRAERVRDFTWSASSVQRWTATSAVVPDRDGDGDEDRVMIHSFWREDRAPLWQEQALYAKHSIEFHSRLTGLAYPWPHMTSVEGDGIIGGGMEFPMMTIIGAYRERGARNLYGVTAHELAHMWFPMIIGSNEKRHAWMDEGFATFMTAFAVADWFEDEPLPDITRGEEYYEVARAEMEQPLMMHGDFYPPGPGYGIASYAKSATLYLMLRNLLGEETWERAVHTYASEWAFKYASPWDFFNTIERFAGSDLDWLWGGWYYETWVLDHAVAEVTADETGTTIVIEDRGFAPMPVTVRVTTEHGEGTARGDDLLREIPVSWWLRGETRYEMRLSQDVGEIVRVEIDPGLLLPDVDRANNVWPPEPEEGTEEGEQEQEEQSAAVDEPGGIVGP